MAVSYPNGVAAPEPSDLIPENGAGGYQLVASTADAAIGEAALTQGTMPLNTNLDSWVDDSRNGLWHASAATAGTVAGLPPGAGGQPFQLLQLGSKVRVTTQLYIPYGYYSEGMQSRSVSNVATNEWTEWGPVGGAGLEPMVQHTIRQVQMISALGPVDTGGLGAVAIRCDHGLTNFRDKVLPLTQARGIKVAMAYNPRNWHYDENAGVTPSDLNSWVAAGDVEIMNHSADHLGADTREALYDEIVNGLAEIEAELPAAAGKVWGFAIPGVSSGDYGGFDEGRTPEGWDTYAGQLILQHHAVGTGYLPGTSRRVLDGQPRDGLGHVTIDGRAVADIEADIDEVIASRRGLQLMMHPSLIDTTGYMSTAGLTEVLDYIAAKRDAGEIAALSPYEMLLADSTRPTPTVADVTGLAARLADLEYDTGWRDVTALLGDQYISGEYWVRRVGDIVFLHFYQLKLVHESGSSTRLAWNIVRGLQPSTQYANLPFAGRSSDYAAGPMRVSRYGVADIYGMAPDLLIDADVSFHTQDVPLAAADLPGVAVSI